MHHRVRGARRMIVPFTILAVLLGMFQPLPAHAAITFIVNSTGDADDANVAAGPFDGICDDGTGQCTLRAAIQEANAAPLDDLIHFDIAGTAPYTISPGSALPSITGPVTIDGTSEPDYPTAPFATTPAAPVVVLDGSAIPDPVSPPGSDGLTLDADSDNSEIRGLRIVHFHEAGIHALEGADGVKIRANQIGTDGTDAFPNGVGVLIESDNVAIGDNGPDDANLISGNGDLTFGSDGGNGIHLSPLTSDAIVAGNLIGTNADGDGAVPNEHNGIVVEGSGHVIGGSTPADRNVISGNVSRGIWLNGSSVTDVAVQGNYIGTDVTGTAALVPLDPGPVQGRGIEAAVTGVVTIGSSVAGTTAEGNVISGNGYGIYLYGTSGAAVGDNLIGTAADGTTAIGNSETGVVIQGFSTFPADANHLRGNTIAASGFYGVMITSDVDGAASANVVTDNHIGTDAAGADLGNTRSGIYIQETGGDTTPNDDNIIGGIW